MGLISLIMNVIVIIAVCLTFVTEPALSLKYYGAVVKSVWTMAEWTIDFFNGSDSKPVVQRENKVK